MNATKQERIARLYANCTAAGLEIHETTALMAAERALSAWAVRECNGEIQRDEETGKPYRRNPDRDTSNTPREYIRDGEAAAMRKATAAAANVIAAGCVLYRQGDPRGCALHLVRPSDIPEGGAVNQYYRRGIALCL